MLTRPIPPAALPVVRVLRRDVKRPATLPEAVATSKGEPLRWLVRDFYCCPMGLAAGSKRPCPTHYFDFADGTQDEGAVRAFGDWWDSLTEAEAAAAVDAVWPKEER